MATDGIKQMCWDMREIRAKTFVRSKRRLPETEYELYEWLLEFESYNLEAIQKMHEAMMEYALVKPASGYTI